MPAVRGYAEGRSAPADVKVGVPASDGSAQSAA